MASIGVISNVPPMGGMMRRRGCRMGSVIFASMRAISLSRRPGNHDINDRPRMQNAKSRRIVETIVAVKTIKGSKYILRSMLVIQLLGRMLLQ